MFVLATIVMCQRETRSKDLLGAFAEFLRGDGREAHVGTYRRIPERFSLIVDLLSVGQDEEGRLEEFVNAKIDEPSRNARGRLTLPLSRPWRRSRRWP